jgi:hypothetical protein
VGLTHIDNRAIGWIDRKDEGVRPIAVANLKRADTLARGDQVALGARQAEQSRTASELFDARASWDTLCESRNQGPEGQGEGREKDQIQEYQNSLSCCRAGLNASVGDVCRIQPFEVFSQVSATWVFRDRDRQKNPSLEPSAE